MSKSKKNLQFTIEEIRAVDGLSSREAAIVLKTGKSTVNDYRKRYADKENIRTFGEDDRDSGLVGVETDAESFHEVWKGNEGVITVVIREELTHENILLKFGHDPEKVRILGVLEETHWMYNGKDWNHRYKFKTERNDTGVYMDLDPVGVLAQLRAHTPVVISRELHKELYLSEDEGSTFVLSINDIQLGQAYNGGSAATITQFYVFIEEAVDRIHELRDSGRTLERLVILGGGDLVEGCVIYGNQAFSLDMHRKQQIEGVIALILHAIDTLAPMFHHVSIVAARGNHGENRIGGKYTTLGDNDDTHVFEMAKLALARDPEMQHIDWVIADTEAGVATKVYDWVLATTHGDVFAKGVTGSSIDKKAHNWMKNMAISRKKFGLLAEADVLITHHFHHEKGSDWGECLWRQTTSQDRGSPYFEQATGEYSQPGMLTFVMTESTRYQDEKILR